MSSKQCTRRRWAGFSTAFVTILASCLGGQLFAALDPETKKPYDLQVVLHFSQHRLFTPVFQDQVKHELRDGLQAAMGPLARVEVTDKHPLLKEVLSPGGLEHALGSWNMVTDTKTQFILIDFVDGRYDIQSRQHDGFTGLASPVVRHTQVDDRQLVSRQAALLINQDFGPVGTLGKRDGDFVQVELKAGKLGAPLEEWIQKGDVLAIAQIRDQGTRGLRSQPIPWTLLQVNDGPQDGVCRCRLYNRWENPIQSGPGILGYRCLKLGTTKAHVRIRLVSDGKSPKPLVGKQISISNNGFDGNRLDVQSTTPEGLMSSPSSQKYDHIAFVKIHEGQLPLAQVPVPVIDDRVVTIPVNADPQKEQEGRLYRDRDRWIRHLYDSLEATAAVVKELNDLGATPGKQEEAKAKAQAALKSIDADISNATEEHALIEKQLAEIAKQPKAKPLPNDFLIEGNKRIDDLRVRRDDIRQYIDKLDRILAEVHDPKRREWQQMWERGRLLEKDADYQQAINLYETVFAQGYEDAKRREDLNKLKQDWRLRDKQHEEAHAFIYETWPRLRKAKEIRDNLPKAKEAFEVCRKVRDMLRPRMLLKVNLAHISKIDKELDILGNSEDDRKTAELIDKLVDELKQFSDSINDYLH